MGNIKLKDFREIHKYLGDFVVEVYIEFTKVREIYWFDKTDTKTFFQDLEAFGDWEVFDIEAQTVVKNSNVKTRKTNIELETQIVLCIKEGETTKNTITKAYLLSVFYLLDLRLNEGNGIEEVMSKLEEQLPFKDNAQKERWVDLATSYRFWDDFEEMTRAIIDQAKD